MKILYLMRHAEAVDLADSDFERYLTDFGCLQAKQQARHFLNANLMVPQKIKASPAWRASQTATIFASQLSQSIELELVPQIYNAVPQTLLQTVCETSDIIQTLFLVGHNNGISEFSAALLGVNFQVLPTSAIVAIQFMVDNWQAIDFDLGKKLCQITYQP